MTSINPDWRCSENLHRKRITEWENLFFIAYLRTAKSTFNKSSKNSLGIRAITAESIRTWSDVIKTSNKFLSRWPKNQSLISAFSTLFSFQCWLQVEGLNHRAFWSSRRGQIRRDRTSLTQTKFALNQKRWWWWREKIKTLQDVAVY